MTARVRLSGLACLGLLVAACSDPGSGATEIASSTKHTIEIRAMEFKPAEVRAHPGDTVVWVNRDIVPHNVADPSKWASPALAKGERWELVVEDLGVLDYICDFHPVMEGRLLVERKDPTG